MDIIVSNMISDSITLKRDAIPMIGGAVKMERKYEQKGVIFFWN